LYEVKYECFRQFPVSSGGARIISGVPGTGEMLADKVVRVLTEVSHHFNGWGNGGRIPGFLIISDLVK
jgi:hypothetical protein